MNHKMALNGDESMNPALREQVQGLRGVMQGQAEKAELPLRFKVEDDLNEPAVHIIDLLNGRTTRVSLFAYRSVREALADLFKDDNRVPMDIVRRLIEAHNSLAFILRNDDKQSHEEAACASMLALSYLIQAMDIIPKDYLPGPEDTGRVRGFQAMQDAEACLRQVANDGTYWMSSFTQACMELWCAAMNYADGSGIDAMIFVKPHLAPTR